MATEQAAYVQGRDYINPGHATQFDGDRADSAQGGEFGMSTH